MSAGPPQVVQPQIVEQRKSTLLERIQARLAKAERRLKELEMDVARRVEQLSRTEAALRAAEAAYQRQVEEERASLAVLEALEREFNKLESEVP